MSDARTATDNSAANLTPFDVPAAADLIERLCKLQQEVMESVLGYDMANDCFCGRGGSWNSYRAHHLDPPEEYWRSSGTAVDFIEKATRNRIQEYRTKHAQESHTHDD